MIEVAARLALAGVLLAAAVLKLARPRESAAAMATYGLGRFPARWAAWASVIALELGLAGGVALGSDAAAYIAAAVMAAFALAMTIALAAGRGGRSCACFGARSRVGWPAVGRSALLAAAFAAVPALPGGELATDQWLGLGLAIALVWLLASTVALLSLAREVGELRLRFGPAADSALEIPEEGPPVGERVEMAAAWGGGDEMGAVNGRVDLILAVFFSEGCHLCRALEPQVRAFVDSPAVVARVLDAVADSEAWQALSIPGSPYAVAFDLDGTVLAKGSFNTVAQLESVLATAERRRDALRAALPDG